MPWRISTACRRDPPRTGIKPRRPTEIRSCGGFQRHAVEIRHGRPARLSVCRPTNAPARDACLLVTSRSRAAQGHVLSPARATARASCPRLPVRVGHEPGETATGHGHGSWRRLSVTKCRAPFMTPSPPGHARRARNTTKYLVRGRAASHSGRLPCPSAGARRRRHRVASIGATTPTGVSLSSPRGRHGRRCARHDTEAVASRAGALGLRCPVPADLAAPARRLPA